jgi:hypothetical protein
MRQVLFFSTLLFIFLTLSSCGEDKERTPASASLVGLEVGTERTLSSDERSLLLEVCYAFRSKWTEFRQNYRNEVFRFNFQAETCEFDSEDVQVSYDQVLTTRLIHFLDRTPMFFDSSDRIGYLSDMETHLHGRLAPLCERAMRGESVKNKMVIDEGKEVRYFSFDRSFNTVYYSVGLAKKDSELFYGSEVFEVLINPQKKGHEPFTGIVIRSTRHYKCENSNNHSRYYQEFIFP